MSAVSDPFIRAIALPRERIADESAFPFSVPAIRALAEQDLELHAGVTFFIGENGSGKSTLIEAVAVAAGFNPEGGTTDMRFATHESHSELHGALRLVRGTRRPRTGFFLRAESFFNVATLVERLGEDDSQYLERYGGVSLHERSHGESFLAHRLDDGGVEAVAYEQTEHYQLTRSFLESPGRFLRHLFDGG